jgi:hypothetical protein
MIAKIHALNAKVARGSVCREFLVFGQCAAAPPPRGEIEHVAVRVRTPRFRVTGAAGALLGRAFGKDLFDALYSAFLIIDMKAEVVHSNFDFVIGVFRVVGIQQRQIDFAI